MSVKELLQSGDCGKEVEIYGWVRTKRGNKQVNFVALNDGSTVNNIQVVVDMNNFPEELLKKVTTGAAVHVRGLLVESSGSGQAREIQASFLKVLGEADPDKYPIQPKNIVWNSCGKLLICVFVQTHLVRYSGFVTRWLLLFINISTSMVSFTCILR